MTKIRITSYKVSGKYYTEHESILKPEHDDLPNYKLMEVLDSLRQDVRGYFGVQGIEAFFHTVTVVESDNPQKFCDMLITNKC